MAYLFQYNHCFGGTCRHPYNKQYYYWFQYNHCFGGTQIKKWLEIEIFLFQYNHCFGGTIGHDLLPVLTASFNTTIVSVEQKERK